MLCVLLGEGPWKGCRVGLVFKGEQCESPHPAAACPLHPGLISDSEPLSLHLEAADVATLGSFGSFHHVVLSSTGQIMPLIPRTNQRRIRDSCFGRGQGSISDPKVRGKEATVQLVDPKPQRSLDSSVESRWDPKSPEDQDFF